MPTIAPDVPEIWIRAVLLATTGATATVGGETVSADITEFCAERIAPAREGFSPLEFAAEGETEADVWPYVLFSQVGKTELTDLGQFTTAAVSVYLIRAFHREDLCGTDDVEDAVRPGYFAICEAFQGANDTNLGGTFGTVHGAFVESQHRALYGEPGRRVAELGITLRVVHS